MRHELPVFGFLYTQDVLSLPAENIVDWRNPKSPVENGGLFPLFIGVITIQNWVVQDPPPTVRIN